jgi:16S rRNA C1402 N4-methylase RsmH
MRVRIKNFAAGRRNDEVIRPTAAERRANPRSAPAKLRWARRAA